MPRYAAGFITQAVLRADLYQTPRLWPDNWGEGVLAALTDFPERSRANPHQGGGPGAEDAPGRREQKV